MLYYILPKIYTKIIVTPQDHVDKCPLYISHSLCRYYTDMHTKFEMVKKNSTELVNVYDNDNIIEDAIMCTPNPFNKVEAYSELFYELVEFLIVSDNNYECFLNKQINILHITPNYYDSYNSFEYFKKTYNYTHTNSYTHFNTVNDYMLSANTDKFEFMFFELPIYDFQDLNKYIIHFLQIVMIIIKTQRANGCCLIKLNYIYHKPIIDILFLLSSLYSKLHLIKPTLMDTTDYKYVFCEGFVNSLDQSDMNDLNYKILDDFLNKSDLKNITQIIHYSTPAYFIYKINEINLIIGQQQLELFRQLLNIYMGQNKLYKLSQFKKKQNQKHVDWCNKMKIPCNTHFDQISNLYPNKLLNRMVDVNLDNTVNPFR